MSEKPLLIVFTDELGSTQRDFQFLKDLVSNAEPNITEFKNKLVESRLHLFEQQIKKLKAQNNKKWTVIKTVGDSLIISFSTESNEELEKIVCDCLKLLFDIWITSNKSIRIVCHMTYADHIITGNELNAIKDCFNKYEDNLDLKSVLHSMYWDIFGPDMNKAARLASIPRNSIFVVSQEVMELIYAKSIIEKILVANTIMPLKLSNSGNIIAYPVPVVNIRGFEPIINKDEYHVIKNKFSLDFDEEIDKLKQYIFPWYIWEIEETNKQVEVSEDNLPLRVQFKELQSLKIVAAKFKEVGKKHISDAKQSFADRLKKNPCQLFVDCVFDAQNPYELYSPNLFRRFYINGGNKKSINWKHTQDKDDHATLRHLYIMFTSVPDIKTNWLMRKYFTPESSIWKYQHISYDIYESTIFQDGITFDSKHYYYLLLFQIKDEFSDEADNSTRFFYGSSRKILQSYAEYQCNCIAFGLLRGEFDGFILFSSLSDNIKELKAAIKNNLNNSNSFFYKIAPIYLYDLKLRTASVTNIEYLKYVRKYMLLLNR